MSAERAVYLDSSALVKLVVEEPESEGLTGYLREHPLRVSCALARVEVPHAVHKHGAARVNRARLMLDDISLIRLDDALLDSAGSLAGSALRSLDAIHLAAARDLGPTLAAVVTYDRRMAAAADELELPVEAPS